MDQYGGEKKSKKTKKTIKSTKNSTKPKTKKPAAKKTTKTTKTRSKTKGGNFLGSVGDLVAPTGWGPFATAAGLFAVDSVSAALRKGMKEKKMKKEKMKGGLCQQQKPDEIRHITIGSSTSPSGPSGLLFNHYNGQNVIFKNNLSEYQQLVNKYDWINSKENQNIVIECNENGKFYFKVNIKCRGVIKTYDHLPTLSTSNKNKDPKSVYDTFEEAERMAKNPNVQVSLIKLALLSRLKISINI